MSQRPRPTPVASATHMAREFVAAYFAAVQREDLAGLVLAGSGDDFEEVRAAENLLSLQASRIARYELALAQYAEVDFWDDTMPGGSLATHDGGEMARNVLAGKPPFFHRD